MASGLKTSRKSTSGPARPVSNEPMLKATLVEEPVAVGERNLKPTSGVTISDSIPPEMATMHPDLVGIPEGEMEATAASYDFPPEFVEEIKEMEAASHVEHAQTEEQSSKIDDSVKSVGGASQSGRRQATDEESEIKKTDTDSELPMMVGGQDLITFNEIEEFLPDDLMISDDPLDRRAAEDLKDYFSRYADNPGKAAEHFKSPPKALSNEAFHLAKWITARLGIETFSRGHFWSRFARGKNWKSNAFGARQGKKAYKLGYIFEKVPTARILGEIHKINDLNPGLTTKNGEQIGIIRRAKQQEILHEMEAGSDNDSQGKSSFFGQSKGADGEQFGFACLGSVEDPDHPCWITVKDDLSAWYIEPLNPKIQRETWAIDCDAYGPNDKIKDPCPVFDKFLEDSFAGSKNPDEMIDSFYEFFGAALLGITHRYKRALFLYGETDTGKSVLADTFANIFPPEAQQSHTLSDLQNKENCRADLASARVNIVTETRAANGSRWNLVDSQVFKQAVSGETFSGRHLYKDNIRITPRCAFVFCGNDRIPLADNGGAVTNRFNVLYFKNRVAKNKQDELLAKKIKAETNGIIYKSLNAVLRLPKTKLTDPEDSKTIKGLWSDLTRSNVESWLRDRAIIHRLGDIKRGQKLKKSTHKAKVYRDYCDYCAQVNSRAENKQKFYDSLRRRGVTDLPASNDGQRLNVVLKDNDR